MLTTAALKDVRAASVLLDIARRYGVGTESEAPEHSNAEEDAELLNDFAKQQRKRAPKAQTTSESGDERQ